MRRSIAIFANFRQPSFRPMGRRIPDSRSALWPQVSIRICCASQNSIVYYGEMMIFRRLVLSFVLLTSTSFAQDPALNSSGFDSSYKLTFRNAVQDKNFYLLSLFQHHPEIRRLLRQNRVLQKLSNDKVQALRMAGNCDDVGCFDRLLRLSGPTIETVAIALKALGRHPEFKKLVMRDMRPSGAFIKYSKQTDSE